MYNLAAALSLRLMVLFISRWVGSSTASINSSNFPRESTPPVTPAPYRPPPKWEFTASGGPVSKGMPYIVGEQRPEVFVPGSDGYIFPSISEFEQMFARAGGRGGNNNSRTNNFNLNMNVQNANQNTVQRSFEMMRLFTR